MNEDSMSLVGIAEQEFEVTANIYFIAVVVVVLVLVVVVVCVCV